MFDDRNLAQQEVDEAVVAGGHLTCGAAILVMCQYRKSLTSKKRLAKRFGRVGDAQINFASRDLAHDRLARDAGAIKSGPNPAMDLGRDDDFEAGAAELGIAVQ